MKACPAVLSFLFLAAAAGCDVEDVLPTTRESRRLEEAQRLEDMQRAAEKEDQPSLAGARQALSQHLAAVSKMLADDLLRNAEDRKRLLDDRMALSDRVKAAMKVDAAVRRSRADVLAALLEDETVNALAMRYLGRDFRMSAAELGESVSAARDRLRQREADEAENDAEYDQAVKDARKEAERARASVLQSEARLGKEIEALEKKQSMLRKSLTLAAPLERRKRESELRSIEMQLNYMRVNYNSIRAGREIARDSQQARRETERAMNAADRRRKDGEERIRKAYRADKSLAEIVTQCEKSTMDVLTQAISERVRKSEGAEDQLKRAQSYVASVVSGLEKLNGEALQRLRNDVDARVAELATER